MLMGYLSREILRRRRPYSTDAVVFSDEQSQPTSNEGSPTKRKNEPDFLQAVQRSVRPDDKDGPSSATTSAPLNESSGHPASSVGTQPKVVLSPDLNEIVLEAGQVELPSMVSKGRRQFQTLCAGPSSGQQTSRKLASTLSQPCPRCHLSQGRSNSFATGRCQGQWSSQVPQSSTRHPLCHPTRSRCGWVVVGWWFWWVGGCGWVSGLSMWFVCVCGLWFVVCGLCVGGRRWCGGLVGGGWVVCVWVCVWGVREKKTERKGQTEKKKKNRIRHEHCK